MTQFAESHFRTGICLRIYSIEPGGIMKFNKIPAMKLSRRCRSLPNTELLLKCPNYNEHRVYYTYHI